MDGVGSYLPKYIINTDHVLGDRYLLIVLPFIQKTLQVCHYHLRFSSQETNLDSICVT